MVYVGELRGERLGGRNVRPRESVKRVHQAYALQAPAEAEHRRRPGQLSFLGALTLMDRDVAPSGLTFPERGRRQLEPHSAEERKHEDQERPKQH